MFLFEKATSLGEPTSLGRACVSPLLVMLLATSRSQWTKLGLNRSSVGRGAPKRTLSTPSTPEKPAPPTTRASLISSYQECLNEVKRLDYPHYFCSRYLPPQARVTMIALRTFNIETAAVKSQVSNAATAQLRLQWWRHAIEKCYKGDGSGHPVTELLTSAVKEGKLTKGWFLRLLESRAHDLTTSQPRTLEDLEKYAEDTSSSLFYLGLESMSIRDLNADHAASHVGKALGLVTLIKALPFHCRAREVYIPTELTAKHNITSEMLFKGEFTPQIGEAIFEMASVAHGHIEMARELTKSLPQGANLVLLPSEFYADYLERLRYTQFNPWHTYLNHNSALTRPRVVLNYYTNKF